MDILPENSRIMTPHARTGKLRPSLTFLTLSLMVLSACALPDQVAQPVLVAAGPPARLDDLLSRTTDANLLVARIEAAGASGRIPEPAPDLPPNVQLPEVLLQPVSVDWTGPVEPLLEALADHVGYTWQVTGPAPAHPLVVTISRRDEPIWLLMRDVAISLTSSATVIVNPSREVVSLQYPVHH